MEEQVNIKVIGRVQGVGFRYAVERTARRLGLKGWVCNQADGSVKIVVKGDKDKIKELIDWCDQGPLFAQIEKVQVEKQKIEQDLKDFKIIY